MVKEVSGENISMSARSILDPSSLIRPATGTFFKLGGRILAIANRILGHPANARFSSTNCTLLGSRLVMVEVVLARSTVKIHLLVATEKT